MSYQTAPIGALFDIKNGATPQSGYSDYWDGDIPWVTPADLGKAEGLTIRAGAKSITRAGLESCGTQLVKPGTLILSIRAPIGHVAIADQRMCFNQGCRGLAPRRGMASRFAFWAMVNAVPALQAAGQGTTFMELGRSKLRSIHIPYPDLHTQKRIADFLDRETERIDELIGKKGVLLNTFALSFEALISSTLSDQSLPSARFEHLSKRMLRGVNLTDHDDLVRLGLYNRGRGIFKKPAADEEGMGSSEFFFVEEGDLIISGQFAWEGSVAMAGEGEAGCVVSHRYPVYRGTMVKTSYLLAFFRSTHGDFLLNEASRGSAGRNRPLNTRRLEKEKLPVPPVGLQQKIDDLTVAEAKLRKTHSQSIDRLRGYRAALITAAVTGQIDIDNYSRAGKSAAALEQIEEEILS